MRSRLSLTSTATSLVNQFVKRLPDCNHRVINRLNGEQPPVDPTRFD
jgi:hypothetical protein